MNLALLLDTAADGFGGRVVFGSQAEGVTASHLRDLSRGGAAVIAANDADSVVYLATIGLAFPTALFAASVADVSLVPLNYPLGDEAPNLTWVMDFT